MSLKKLLGIISIVIIVMFALMLTTSYAWYSFENASTEFNAVTSNNDVIVSYQKGEYINTNIAVPIKSIDVDKYSEKNNFIVKVKDNDINNEMLVSISLVDISIDGALQSENFKISLYHQNTLVTTVAGNSIGISGATTKALGTVSLDENIDNNFELRVYILDNDANQSSMMNRTFRAKIKVDVVSRVKTIMTDYNNTDIYVSSITIDGTASNSLPTNGYYTMSSTCTKGSNLSWEPFTKTITYASGAKVNDSCSLTFTSATSTKLLSTVEPGSYVKYTGANGCDGKHCEGNNANYVSDTNMGYCYNSNYKFTNNGWQVAYVKNNTAYLISAGAPECVRTLVGDTKSSSTYYVTNEVTFDSAYYYGTGYTYDEATGMYSLTGVSSALTWSNNYESIINTYKYTCKATSSTTACDYLYEIAPSSTSTRTSFYKHTGFDTSENHIAHLNKTALKYCNKKYAYGGVCDSNSAWGFNGDDYNAITNTTLASCSLVYGNKSCGYVNNIIDNGSRYWIATSYNSNSTYFWSNSRIVGNYYSAVDNGVRPILRLNANVVVKGGTGTYEDPYIIGI